MTDLDDAALDFPGADSIITAGAVNALLTGTSTLILAATDSGTINAALTGSGDANLTLNAPTLNLNQTVSLAGSGVLSGNATMVNVGTNGRIQNGVDVAASGGTVAVAAGNFVENVSVAKTLTLQGAQMAVDAAALTAVNPVSQSVINGQVQLTAPNTTFDGFTVTNSSAGAGVVASNAQGDQIKNNFITDNVFGLSLASDGSSPLRVEHNHFKDNNLAGSASGNGIYTDFTVSNVLVNANKFSEHLSGSVSFYGSAVNPQSNVSITGNTIDHDGPIGLATVTGVTISGNTINRNGFDSLDVLDPAASGDAIWIGGGVGTGGAAENIEIQNNLITNNAGAGIKFTKNSSSVDANPSANFKVFGNSFSGNADGAIFINTSEGSRYTGILNASGNWWGDASGPNVVRSDYTGGGQGIDNAAAAGAPNDDLVDFTPWLDTGVPAVAGTPGFIGNFSALHVSPLSPQFGYNASDDSTGRIAEALGLLTGANRTLHLWDGTYDDQDSITIPGAPNPVAVVLNGNVTLQSKNGIGDITFNSSIDSAADTIGNNLFHYLVVDTGGVTRFGDGEGDDRVGAVNALGSLTTDDALVDAPTGERTLFDIAQTGTDVATMQNTTAGATGNQTYNDAVVLEQDTVLAAINGDPTNDEGSISFNASVDSAASEFNDLTVNTGGVTRFGDGSGDDGVGAVDPLGSLTTDFDGSFPTGPTGERTVFDIAGAGTDVATSQNTAAGATGSQTYNDAVVLEQDTVLAAINGDPTTGEGSISFNASVDSAASEFNDLTVNTGGVTRFGDGSGDDGVGAVDALGSLTTDFDGSFPTGPAGERTLFDIANAGTDVATLQNAGAGATGSQTYNDAVVLEQDTVLAAINGDPTTGEGSITFNASVDSAATEFNDLTVNTGGVTRFGDGSGDDRVGAVAALGNLATDLDGSFLPGPAGERTVFNIADTGSDVRTSLDQNYNDAVVLGADTVLTSTTGGNINFGSTVHGTTAGTESLAVNTGGTTTFGGNVGTALIPLESLSTADAAGTAGGGITVLGGTAPITVTTSAAAGQHYFDNVRLAQDTTLNAGATGAVSFDGTVNGTTAGTESLAVNTGGTTTFGGNVGTGVALESLSTADAAGTAGGGITVLGGTAPITVTTSAAAGQHYRDNVRLAQDTTLNAGATGAVSFDGTVNGTSAGTESLAVNAGGTTTFGGNVGTGVALESLTTADAAGTAGGGHHRARRHGTHHGHHQRRGGPALPRQCPPGPGHHAQRRRDRGRQLRRDGQRHQRGHGVARRQHRRHHHLRRQRRDGGRSRSRA